MTKRELRKMEISELYNRKEQLNKQMMNEGRDNKLNELGKEVCQVEQIIDAKEKQIVASLNY